MSETFRIFEEEKDEIEKKVEKIVNGLVPINIENNQLAPQWEEKANIVERMKVRNVPGLSIALIDNFKIEWAKSFGIRDARTEDSVTLETLFESGSTAKSFTATAVLREVEKKTIKLDEDINNFLTTWKLPENDMTADNKVTMKQLLTHTAGINRPDSMFGVEPGKVPTINQVLNGEKPAINDPAKVEFKPGSNHQYSNLAYIIIEKILTDVCGKPFSELMKENILEPLSMSNSIFQYPTGDLAKKAIVPHDQNGEAKETGMSESASAHCGLLTTPIEMCNFVLELMNAYNGKSVKIFTPESIKQMLSPALALDPAKFFGFTGQALGMFLIEKDKDLFFTHPGTNMPGAVCMMIGSPTRGQGLVIMSNGIGAELLHLEILYGIAEYFDWPIWRKE